MYRILIETDFTIYNMSLTYTNCDYNKCKYSTEISALFAKSRLLFICKKHKMRTMTNNERSFLQEYILKLDSLATPFVEVGS